MADTETKDLENTILMELKDGTVTIELLPDVAPLHCARMKDLVRTGQYDNVAFHRVIDGFMAQTGDVKYGNTDEYGGRLVGTGQSDYANLPAEFSDETFARGTVGMARSSQLDSANSQFFIMFAPGDFLDGQYTIVGKVTSGLEVLDAIKRGNSRSGSITGAPDFMKSVKVTD